MSKRARMNAYGQVFLNEIPWRAAHVGRLFCTVLYYLAIINNINNNNIGLCAKWNLVGHSN